MQERQVWAQLALVTDPELDEALTDLGFVEGVSVNGDDVEVTFRLPTYWCSPNFAFLMAESIRAQVGQLPWVARVTVRLQDHMCADEMMDAVNQGRTFSDAFALRPDGGDLTEVREKFEGKAYQRRQEAVLLGLRAMGFTPAQLAAMTIGQLDLVQFEGEAARQLPRYRELLVKRALAGSEDPAFPDFDGTPLTVETYADRMGALRAVRINMEFGGALCRGLKQTRYKEHVTVGGEATLVDRGEPAFIECGEPTLADFIAGRVPPRVTPG